MNMQIKFHLSPHALKTLRGKCFAKHALGFPELKGVCNIFNKPNVASPISSSVSLLIQSIVTSQQVSVRKGNVYRGLK